MTKPISPHTLKTQIDQMVYKLYDLTADEVKIVEKNT